MKKKIIARLKDVRSSLRVPYCGTSYYKKFEDYLGYNEL